ncbi:MAG: glycosyltransferase family 4 protein [Magnetococcales bacterium]|nr:glycosyltransferase family 4 protein [Magnetococcales bacterium]
MQCVPRDRIVAEGAEIATGIMKKDVTLVVMRYTPFGGDETQAALLAEHLVAAGCHVTLLCADWRGGPLPSGMTWVRIPMWRGGSWLKVWSFARAAASHLKKHPGMRAIAFSRVPGATFYRAGSACHAEWLRLRQQTGGWRAALSMAINPLHRVIRGIEGHIFADTVRQAGRIIVMARLGQEQIQRFYPIPDDRFVVIPPMVDLSRFQKSAAEWIADRHKTRSALGVDENEAVLLHVGSGFRIKRLALTLAVVAELTQRGQAVRLLIAGFDRKEQSRHVRLAQQLGIAEQVTFLGGVADMAPCYAAADLLLLPSLLETFGVVVAEALYCGLPVVISTGMGARDLVLPAATCGRVVAVDAGPTAWAAAVAETLDQKRHSTDPDADAARRRMAALPCMPERVLAQYLDLLAEIQA